MDTIEIAVQDLDDAKQIIAACLRYFQAEDLKRAQVNFSAVRPSPLTMEIDAVHARFAGYLSDHLLALHEAVLDEDEEAEAEAEADDEDLDGEELDDEDEEEEELPEEPLGAFSPPRQEGRVLTAEEIQQSLGD